MKVTIHTKEQVRYKFGEGTTHVVTQGEINPEELETKKFLKVTRGVMVKWIKMDEIIRVEQLPQNTPLRYEPKS